MEKTRLYVPEVALYLNPIRSILDKQAVLQVGVDGWVWTGIT